MFDFEKLSSARFYVAPTVEKVLEFTPDGIDVENILKVLSLSVDAKCESAEAFDGYAQIAGRANFKLIYLDKEGVAKGVDYNADFTARVDGEFSAGDNVSTLINVAEAEVSANLTLSAVLEITAGAVKREEMDVLVNAEECYCKKAEMTLPSFVGTKTTTADYFDDYAVGGEIDSVLAVNATVAIKEATANENGAYLKSLVCARVVYMQEGQIEEHDFEIPLEEDLNFDGLLEGDSLKVSAQIKNAKIILQGVTGDNIIRVEGEVFYKIDAFRCAKYETITDVFLLSNETVKEYKKYEGKCIKNTSYLDESVSGIALLGDNRPPAEKVVALPSARCYTVKTAVDENGKIICEGVVNADIVYLDENGYNAIRAEIPFSLDLGEAEEGTVYSAHCVVTRADAKVRREREFEINLNLDVCLTKYFDTECEYIAGVELGEERPANTSALSMYIAGEGEDMLDVCKALYAMPDEILAQNPDLAFPLEEGTEVIYFRQLK